MNNQEQPRKKKSGCLKGIIIFIVIYIVCSVLSGIWLGKMFSSGATLENNSVYVLKMKGTLVEQGQEDNPFASLMGEMPGYSAKEVVGLDDLVHNIRLAKENDKIRGILLQGGEMQMGLASAKALRDALIDYKESGKFLIAYSSNYTHANYYVACVADSLYLNPTGTVGWNGLSANKMYFKRLLDKIGVEMQVLKVGTFKSAVEPYVMTKMSDADRQQTRQYIDGLWNELLQGVSASRHITPEDLNRYADLYMELQQAEAYVENGFVDRLVYTEDIDSILIRLTGTDDYNKISTSALATITAKQTESDNKIAVLYAEGEITDTEGNGIVGTKMVKEIAKIRKDDDVKAVVLRVNSPGGSADASEQIWHAVQTLREKGLPVVVSMGDYAASGGYYISCGADYIYAEPTTLTGSIGIFGLIPNLDKVRDKVGLDIDGVKTNAYSDLQTNAMYKGMNKEEHEKMQRMVERGYDLFTRRCAEGRHTSQDDIKAIGEGRVWLGKDATGIGLVDAIGGLDKAVAKAAEMAGTSDYELTYYPNKKDFYTQLMEAFDTSSDEEKLIMKMKELCSQPRVMTLMNFPVIH
ncbi:MAG: signal peptide peptidase SppA [Paludibacteraceae bacterium]|nr:signal peptide peptidase SppA [Paludibacteraceae bacterium]